MTLTDVLAVLLGVAIGVLASVPVAMVIAASTARPPARRRRVHDRYAQDVVVEVSSREIVVLPAESQEMVIE